MYWACAQVEPRRERLASHCLGLAGYEIYQPLLREQRKLQYLARVSGGAYFQFDPRTQERQFLELWGAMLVYATASNETAGEKAVKTTGGPAGTLLLEQLKQEPMPVVEVREHVWVKRDT